MRLKLHCTYCCLMLIITLILSCFLICVGASDNEKYITTEPVNDASMASDAQKTSHISKASIDNPTLEQHVEKHAPAAGDQIRTPKKALNEDENYIVLPNYKKVKKFSSEQGLNMSPSPREGTVSTSSVVESVKISETSDEIVNSSNSVPHDFHNSNSAENKNVFNTIVANEEYISENTATHSLTEQSTEKYLPQQVPDMEQGFIKRQHIQDDTADKQTDLPDITDIPTVTVTELPLDILQQPQNTLDSVIIDDGGEKSKDESVNRTIEVIAEKKETQKDDQIVKINDSGGGGDSIVTIQPTATSTSSNADDQEVVSSANNIPTDANSLGTSQSSIINASIEQQQMQQQENASSATSASQVNLTAAEEVPMPVFSEWAQKQMEAAEKQQALEQEQTVNNSAQRKNHTNGNGKPTALKIRAKNYASPDCGAKIIASSADTSNAGAVLSSSKDEYMLSLCGNRIWFVVELCEAIQAQTIDFANFELYSSSPQNFTVAVSKRFPTREWSNVGRFQAEDKRAVQSFDLHPHLFGKFVRVDINSHYSKEHFCTLSLFRVFGTSEFEAFETENHPNEDLDDFDDDYLLEQNTVKHAESNLFKSASDAVLSIVKKATEVLGKPTNSQNQTFKTQPQSVVCRTPIYGLFSCAECPTSLVDKVNNLLTCEFSQLNSLLSNKDVRNDLLNTRVCAKQFGIETNQMVELHKDISKSFYVSVLPNEFVGALCQLLAKPDTISQKSKSSTIKDDTPQKNDATELPTNLTIDKKFGKEDLSLLDHPENKLLKPDITTLPLDQTTKSTTKSTLENLETSTEINLDDSQQLPRPIKTDEQLEAITLPPKIIQKPNLPDTNIFNVPADESSSETEVPVAVTETPTSVESIEQTPESTTPITSSAQAPSTDALTVAPPKSEEDSNSWDNIEHLLTTVPTTITTGNVAGSAQYNQQKSSNSPQSESVFIRLSNRIKALERNMSLSGQYLEELSRRYKKQVEELQQTLTQQIQTVRTLEEENRRHHELEQLHLLRNTQLKEELDNLTLQVHACIVVIIFVGAFVFMVLMVAILFYRSLRRETKEMLSLYNNTSSNQKNDANIKTTSTVNKQKKINRRKSFEDFSDHQQSIKGRYRDAFSVSSSCSDKLRRPSEAAMLILKDCNTDDTDLPQQHLEDTDQQHERIATNHNNSTAMRQRKLSICYGSNGSMNQTNNQCSRFPPQHPQKSQNKRRGEKHSWPNTAHAQLLARQHIEELNAEDLIGDSVEVSASSVGKQPTTVNTKTKKRKESQSLKRQQSSQTTNTDQPEVPDLKSTEFCERVLLDEDDLDNFIPNTDLAYNEFMPDGPRGYQCSNPTSNANNPASKKPSNKQLDNNLKKSRRLSSPVFFKSPFTKSLKGKISNSNKTNPAHESTSWEWYRLKKSSSSASSPNGAGGGGVGSGAQASSSISNTTNNAFLHNSPNASLDSSSLSEINFPTNSTENSFRILEEAILTSGENAITTATTASANCKKSSSGLSSSSNSNRSSSSNSSTQSKKKNRSFNKIFRKVF